MNWSLTLEITIPLFSVGIIFTVLFQIYKKGREFYFELERYAETITEFLVYANDKGKIKLLYSRLDIKQQLSVKRKRKFIKFGFSITGKSKARHKIAYEFFIDFIDMNVFVKDSYEIQLFIWITLNFLIKYKGRSAEFENLYDAFIDDFNNKKDQYNLTINYINEMSLEFFKEISVPHEDNETLIELFIRTKTIKDIRHIVSNEEKYKENIMLRNYIKEVKTLINQLEIESKDILEILHKGKYSILYFDYYSSHATQSIKKTLENNSFTKIFRLTAYIKLVTNSDLKKHDYNLLNWLKFTFKKDFENIHKKGGGFFFLIRFEIQNFQELKFNFEFEPKLLFNSLRNQIMNNNKLFLKLLDLEDIKSNSEFKKLYPIDFLQVPRAFINCALNRNYTAKDFSKILQENDLFEFLNKSEDFSKLNEEKVRQIFSLSKKDFYQLTKSLKTLEMIKVGKLESLMESE